jgi:hypothetical protein
MSQKKKTDKLGLSDEQLRGWDEYRKSLYVRQEKSHDSFEKAITFLSSGSLGLTIALHDTIVPVDEVQFIFLIALGWFSLAATLFVNLVSHYKSSKSTILTIGEIDDVLKQHISFEDMDQQLDHRNLIIDRLNVITIWSLGVGLLSVIAYVILNLYNG